MATVSQRSFTGGEQAPSLQARVDFTKYQTSLKTMRNFIALKHGGASNRPGTEFLAEVRDSTAKTRLIPFNAGSGAAYALEFSPLHIRIYKDGEQLKQAAQAITNISNSNPCVITYSGADTYGSGFEEIYVSGVNGPMGQYLNNRWFKVGTVDTGANTMTIYNMDMSNVNSTSFGTYTSGGTIAEVYQIETEYTELQIPDLQFAQSVDVMTIVHPSHDIKELRRNSDTNWEFVLYGDILDNRPAAVKAMSATQVGAAGTSSYAYAVSCIYKGSESGVFSYPGFTGGKASALAANATLSTTNYIQITVSTTTTSNVQSYNFYKRDQNGTYGLIGNSTTGQFRDIGIDPDTSIRYPDAFTYFQDGGDKPSCVAYAQQRRFFAATNNDKESVWGSAIASYTDFSTPYTATDSTSLLFKAAGKKFNPVRHILDLSKLVLLTESSEIVVNPDGSVVSPLNINLATQTYNGSSKLPPIVINDNALYVQARGSVVRDLLFDFNIDGYSGNDISIFANHLFEGYTITDWCYAQIPNSTVWAVRSDGTLLGLTYLREQQVLAWHRHDFEGGVVESVCSIPASNEDEVYLVIKRNINGRDVRYVERFSSRFVNTNKPITVRTTESFALNAYSTRYYNAVNECTIMDSHLSYDGRNTDTTKQVKLTSAAGWTTDDTLTLTSNTADTFKSTDVGNAYHITTSTGEVIRCRITGYTSGTVVSVNPLKTVPAELRGVFTSHYARAVDELLGLWHLEGKQVAIFADGLVVGSPNNPSYETVTVTNGSISLSNTYSVIHVGLPYVSDLETLTLETMQAETMIDKKVLIQSLTMNVEKTRGLWMGIAAPATGASMIDGLVEVKARNNEGYEDPIRLTSEPVSAIIDSNYSTQGRVFIRQIDPLPATILSIHPAGIMPFKGG